MEEKNDFSKFEICCPLYPLFGRDIGYPDGFKLPPRMRPNDSLDLKKLTDVLKQSSLYPEKKENNQEKEEISVVSVLSPYSHDIHVMVMDLSPELYLPTPELIDDHIFEKICKTVNKCINYMRSKNYKCICAGYNWSPYSFGTQEEITGGQSIPTKFHFSLWTWDDLKQFDKKREIKKEIKRVLGDNKYGLPFAHFFYEKIKTIINNSKLFDEPIFSSTCVFIPFKEGVLMNNVISDGKLIKEIADIIAKNLKRLSEIISDCDIDTILKILKNIEKRLLTNEEVEQLKKTPKINPLNDCLNKCKNENEKEIISALYQYAINREQGKNIEDGIWKKNFSYSLSFCESKMPEIKSGMRIFSLPQCGPGGVVESYNCILSRPESSMATNDEMIRHNNLLWDLADYLKSVK
jgi:hypothetical protein